MKQHWNEWSRLGLLLHAWTHILNACQLYEKPHCVIRNHPGTQFGCDDSLMAPAVSLHNKNRARFYGSRASLLFRCLLLIVSGQLAAQKQHWACAVSGLWCWDWVNTEEDDSEGLRRHYCLCCIVKPSAGEETVLQREDPAEDLNLASTNFVKFNFLFRFVAHLHNILNMWHT